MAGIKIKENGIWKLLNNVLVKGIEVVQTSGSSSANVMSQNAVTEAITENTSGKTDNVDFTAHTSSSVHMSSTEKTNLDSLATNIGAISGITSENVSDWDNAATNSHTHDNKTYLDGISAEIETAAYKEEEYFAGSGHTHSTSIAEDSGENQLTMEFGTKYKLTAGDTGYIFTTPSSAASWNNITAVTTSNTNGNISVNGTDIAVKGLDTMAYQNVSSYSSATEVNTVLGNKTDASAFTAHTADTAIHHTHSNKTYLDGITGTVGTMAYQNASSYSSATEVNTVFTNLDMRAGILSAVTVNSDLSNVTCPDSITGVSKSGAQAIIIYVNGSTTTDYVITASTLYKSPDGLQVNITCPKNGYCEISYVNIGGTIYVRSA